MYYGEWVSVDEEYRVLSRKMVTARKPHLCCSCKKEIAKGDRYIKTAFIQEGHFYSSPEHLGCSIGSVP